MDTLLFSIITNPYTTATSNYIINKNKNSANKKNNYKTTRQKININNKYNNDDNKMRNVETLPFF